MDGWLLEFARLWLGGFLVIFGAVILARAAAFNDVGRYFVPAEHTPELDAALARRMEVESISPLPLRASGAVAALCGAVVLAGWLPGVAGYAIGSCAFAFALAWTYVRLRNRGIRRSAVLAPRRADATLSPVWIAAGVVASCAPLLLLDDTGSRVAAVITSVASFAMLCAAAVAREMPALLSGEDPEREIVIDARLRERRVRGLFGLALGVPFVFFAMTGPSGTPGLPHLLAYGYVFVVWFAFSWNRFGVIVRIRRRGSAC